MHELKHIKGNTYYLESSTNFGVYKLRGNEVVVIDGGLEEASGVELKEALDKENLSIKLIIVTHTHADHTGALNYLQNEYKCKILVKDCGVGILKNPILNPALVIGGYPTDDLLTKYLYSKPCVAEAIDSKKLPKGITFIEFPGHAYDGICVKTDDGVWFLGDNIISEKSLSDFMFTYLCSVPDFLTSLDKFNSADGEFFVPAHASPFTDIKRVIELNRKRVQNIIDLILDLLKSPLTIVDLAAELFYKANYKMTYSKNFFTLSMLRAYLSYLFNDGKITHEVIDNKVYYKII